MSMHPPTRPLGASSQDRHPPSTIHGLSYRDEERRRLRSLAMEQDRLDGLTSNARGRRKKREEVSEETLISLGGRKTGAEIVFGPESGTQLIFTPSKGRFEGAARWIVCLPPVTTSRYDTRRELSKANRGLWDGEKDEPSAAFKAAEQLLACDVEKLQALRVEVRQLHELNERPKTETVMERLSIMGERLNRVSEQVLGPQAAIGLLVEVLSKGLGGKLQIAFDLLRDDGQWQEDISKLRDHALLLAGELQRPPTKRELRKRYNPSGTLKESEFSQLLKHAGLSWLKPHSRR